MQLYSREGPLQPPCGLAIPVGPLLHVEGKLYVQGCCLPFDLSDHA